MSEEKKDFNLDNFKLNYKIWLSTPDDQGIMGDGKWKILKAIEKYGSLRATTEKLGITYRRTWGDLKEIEEKLGIALLEKTRGGKDGGNTCLTPEGKKLVQTFDLFHEKIDIIMEEAFEEFKKTLNEE
ncbi:MAG: LysR family transcriptional regulator [Bacteroidales bacterium]|nr:LysR family transcriptional regulator [Bacteroidales bacterium]